MEPKPATPTPGLNDDPSKSGKKSKVSIRLLAFLSCCTSSNVDTEDTPLPPKKTVKRQSVPSRQPAPEKADVKPGNSRPAEPKEPAYSNDEKPNPTLTADRSQSQAEDKENASSHKGESQVDGSGSDREKSSLTEDYGIHGPDLSQSSSADPKATVVVTGTVQTEDFAQKPEDDPSPVATDKAEHTTTDGDKAIARPLAPETSAEDDVKSSSHEEEATGLPDELPPPPQTEQQESQQQWLLPPPLPHLRNRKCLVLDLDETLVHSSFKVL